MKIPLAFVYLISHSKQSKVVCNLQLNMTTETKNKNT